jgi:hypothetical protein
MGLCGVSGARVGCKGSFLARRNGGVQLERTGAIFVSDDLRDPIIPEYLTFFGGIWEWMKGDILLPRRAVPLLFEGSLRLYSWEFY